MTLEEKIDMLHGEVNGDFGFYNAPIERLGIPALTMADGTAGVRVGNSAVNGGEATAYPAPIALAATWNSRLAETFGRRAGNEAFTTGHNVLLAPAADIYRDARAGRGFEAYGEDPLLSGVMAEREILGIQSNPVLADIKHLAAYNQETNRLVGGNAVVSERALQEIYLRPVGMAVEGGDPGTAMCSFNAINGVPACENEYLLSEILREQMHFAGFVMSDYGATPSTLPALTAGLDQEQPFSSFFGDALLALVRAGTVSQAEIDEHVLNVLRPMFRFGLFDNPPTTTGFNEAANGRVSQTIAEQAAVLLENDGTLPLKARRIDSIAVIGADADTTVAGGGSSLVVPTESISPLQGITDAAARGTDVEYAQGTDPIGAGGALLSGPDPVPSDVLTADDGSRGLNARYWTNLDRSGAPGIDRVEPNAAIRLGFTGFPNLNAQSPKLADTPTDYNVNSSAEWTGTLTVPQTGRYTFSLGVRGSATLFIDGVNRAEVQDETDYREATWSTTLTEGDTLDVRIEYVNDVTPTTDAGPQLKFGWTPPESYVPRQAVDAAELAAESDVAVVIVRDISTEGADRPDLELPQGQDELISTVAAANPRTIVVLTTGGPVTVGSWRDDVAGLIEAWYGGQRQGAAIANILFGTVNPSGHLPVTFPVSENDTPTADPSQFPGIEKDAQYSEGVFVGYRGYRELGIAPEYPFGYGLSYSTFRTRADADRSQVRIGDDGLIRERDLTVDVRVRNTSNRSGSTVVQIYTGRLPGSVDTPDRQLAGWAKVNLRAGESDTVTVRLDPKSFAYWNANRDRWTTPRGTVRLYVGDSVNSTAAFDSVRVVR
jgi:beta-glucosidase